MKFLARLFGTGSPARAPAGRPAANGQPASVQAAHSRMHQSQSESRREVLRVVLRDTLRRHGIPAEWITAEILAASSRNREPGLHLRLAIRHWDARLPPLCVALQNSMVSRLLGFDPVAAQWLHGISWQFELADESACPAMPHPGLWTAPARAEPPAFAGARAAAPATGSVIAGPVKIEQAPEDVKADLAQLMAALDAQYQADGHGDGQHGYAATEPARL